MDEPADMHYSKEILKDYIITLGSLKALILYPKNSSEVSSDDYEGVTGLTKLRIKEIKEAFSSRSFLKEYCDCDISEEILCEFEDFLNGRKETLEGIDERMIGAGKSLEALKFLN